MKGKDEKKRRNLEKIKRGRKKDLEENRIIIEKEKEKNFRKNT